MAIEIDVTWFDFSGRTEIRLSPFDDTHPSQLETKLQDMEDDVVWKLNERSETIARELERTISRFFRSSSVVQAEVRFYSGSVEVLGSVGLSAPSPVVVSAAKAAGGESSTSTISELVRAAIQRVLNRHMPRQVERFRIINVIAVEDLRHSGETCSANIELTGKAVTPEAYYSTPSSGRANTVMTVSNTLLLVLLLILLSLNTYLAFQ